MTPEQLKEFIDRHGLYQRELANLLGVTEMGLHQWIVGRRAISRPVARILRLFDRHPNLMQEFGK